MSFLRLLEDSPVLNMQVSRQGRTIHRWVEFPNGGIIAESRDGRGNRTLRIATAKGTVETIERFHSSLVMAGLRGIHKLFSDGRPVKKISLPPHSQLKREVVQFPG